MRNSWISSFTLVMILCCPITWAQDEKEAKGGVSTETVDPQRYIEVGKQIEGLLRSLRSFQPERTLELIEVNETSEGIKTFFRGWAYHQMGDYKQASKYLHKVEDKDLLHDEYFTNRLKELRNTADELKDFSVLETENFSIRYQNGRDEVMLLLLPDLLEQVYTSYSKLFQYQRDKKIIVELMPDHELFSYASALTRKQIETTGTIALCVENRLAVLTPRRVAMGYYWPDVIAHEFVHYIVTKISHDRVPLWMQEGTAKYFESRWEAGGAEPLDLNMETVLAMALEKDALLTTDQMMPSFAALPTAELALQAYAQTTTMIDYFCEQNGEPALRAIFSGLRDAEGDMDAVLQQHLGIDFAGFENNWRTWLKTQSFRKHGMMGDMGVKLLDEDMAEEKVASLDAENKRHKKFVRLGDLLLERNRYRGALKEYEKILPNPGERADRQVVLRLLTCYRQLDRHEALIAFVDKHISNIESDTTMLIYKARAQLALERNAEAEALLARAMRINPFHPGIYQLLLGIKDENSEEGQMYQKALDLLMNPTATKAGGGVSKS